MAKSSEVLNNISEAARRFSSGKAQVDVGRYLRRTSLDEFMTDLAALRTTLDKNLDDLAATGLNAVRLNVISRARRMATNIGMMEAQTRSGFWEQQEQIDKWGDIILYLSYPVQKLGGGKAGYGSRRALDSVRLLEKIRRATPVKEDTLIDTSHEADGSSLFAEEVRKGIGKIRQRPSKSFTRDPKTDQGTRSEFNILWMIGEFGTGIHASPSDMIREDGPHKVPGSAAWYLGSKLIIYGQKGGHFLFPFRENFDEFRKDLDAARAAIAIELDNLMRKTRG